MPANLLSLAREAIAELSAERLTRPSSAFPVHLVSLGKAALPMIRGARATLGDRVVGVTHHPGSHPVPDASSETAGRALLDAVARVPPDVGILFLVSGGGSAMAAVPAPGLTLADKIATHRALIQSGAPIEAINCVRKHLSALKGGQLARASPLDQTLILCDIPSGDPCAVASGPTLPDPSTFGEALAVVETYRVSVPPDVRTRLERGARGELPETPKPDRFRPSFQVLAAPIDLARAVQRRAPEALVEPRAFAEPVESLARRIVREVRASERPRLLVYAGEPTLRVPPGSPAGGRMQHLALLLALELRGYPFEAVCIGSDGRDGMSEHAGAVVDGSSAGRGVEIGAALNRFDSARACQALEAAVPRFASDTNLCDLIIIRR